MDIFKSKIWKGLCCIAALGLLYLMWMDFTPILKWALGLP